MPTLLYSPASPFARAVRIAAAEKGVALTVENTSVSPVAPDEAVMAKNPLGKVPALVLDDGTVLYDSRVICAWVDAQGSGAKLLPEGAARWQVLTQEALANGLLDAVLLYRYEHALRPEERRFQPWIDGQWAKVTKALDALEAAAGAFAERVDVGTIATACALGYMDLRLGDRPWRTGRPQLAAWYERFSARPSMRATAPN